MLKAKIKVKKTQDIKKIIPLNKDKLEVGFFETAKYSGEHKLFGKTYYSKGEYVAQIAKWNNDGHYSKLFKKYVPPRPFFDNVTRKSENKEAINKQLISILKNYKGQSNYLEPLGVFIRNIIQNEIINLSEPPNTALTIANKKSSNPLIDTGLMIKSVEYRIVK